MENSKVFSMKISKVYPLLVSKAEKKGRTKDEVYLVTSWLTGYTEDEINKCIADDIEYGTFFENAPCINPDASKITGSICGIKVQEIEDSLMQKIRYLDKLVDELAKGKSIDKVLRK